MLEPLFCGTTMGWQQCLMHAPANIVVVEIRSNKMSDLVIDGFSRLALDVPASSGSTLSHGSGVSW